MTRRNTDDAFLGSLNVRKPDVFAQALEIVFSLTMRKVKIYRKTVRAGTYDEQRSRRGTRSSPSLSTRRRVSERLCETPVTYTRPCTRIA